MSVPTTTNVARRGFTLTELMISVAISLALILGIAKVFQLTGDTIGAGTALSSVTRDQRAAQAVFERDFTGLVAPTATATGSPGLIIWSTAQPAYVDRATMDADETVTTTRRDAVNLRTDRLGMFVTGDFIRQSGNDGYLTSSLAAEHAYVWYGHLMLPNNSGQFFYGGNPARPITPGSVDPSLGSFQPEHVATNPNNFFANQWTLGRVAMLMKAKTPDPGPGPASVFDADGVEQRYINDAADMRPFEYDAQATGPNPAPRVQESRYDLVGLDATGDVFTHINEKLAAAANVNTWWNTLDYRFQCDPFPVRPLDAAGLAKTAPLFLPGCSEFIVEFAGDYFPVDGVIDFDDIVTPVTATDNETIRQTRWYGYPRDVNGDGNINASDVSPVTWQLGGARPFERNNGNPSQAFENRPGTFPGGVTPAPYVPPVGNARQYVVAWTTQPTTLNNWPKLIRIIYTTRDANGRLQNPQPIETIFKVN